MKKNKDKNKQTRVIFADTVGKQYADIDTMTDSRDDETLFDRDDSIIFVCPRRKSTVLKNIA